MSDVVRAALAAVVEGRTLTLDEAHAAMGAVMDGEATASQLAAFLVALRMRSETIDELAGFATAMRERVVRVTAPDHSVIDYAFDQEKLNPPRAPALFAFRLPAG